MYHVDAAAMMSTVYASVQRGAFLENHGTVYEMGPSGNYTERRYAQRVWKLIMEDVRAIKVQLRAMARPFARISCLFDAAGSESIMFEPLTSYAVEEHDDFVDTPRLGHEQTFKFERTVTTPSPTHTICSEVGRGAYGALVFAFLMRVCEHTGNDDRVLCVQTSDGKSPWTYREILQVYRLIKWPVDLEAFNIARPKSHEAFYRHIPRDQYVRHVTAFRDAQIDKDAEASTRALVDASVRARSVAYQAWCVHSQAVAVRDKMLVFVQAMREQNDTNTELARVRVRTTYDSITAAIDEVVALSQTVQRSAADAMHHLAPVAAGDTTTTATTTATLSTLSTPAATASAAAAAAAAGPIGTPATSSYSSTSTLTLHPVCPSAHATMQMLLQMAYAGFTATTATSVPAPTPLVPASTNQALHHNHNMHTTPVSTK